MARPEQAAPERAAGRVVIVGAGLAGARTAEALREEGYTAPIVLLGAEPDPPYDRPPLSKEYLQGKTGRDAVLLHPPGWYAEHDIELRTNTTVTAIHPDTGQVSLTGGQAVGYHKLVLATGSTPRRLPVTGERLEGCYYLRTLPDSDRLRQMLATASRLVIIGGGWIGLEVAAAARIAGLQVTVVEADRAPLRRVLGDDMAAVFAQLHRDHGVDLRCATAVEAITGERHVTGVRITDGTHHTEDTQLPADAVLIAVGATPNTQLAEQAGLDVADAGVGGGVIVDASLRTSDPDVYAVGDIARAVHPPHGTAPRVEHWANASHQPAIVAAAIRGEPASYDRLPYFFTDQYELGMEYTGYAPPGDDYRVVVRGDLAARQFIAFWLDSDQRVRAGMNVNIWDVTDPIANLIRSQIPIDPARLADPEVPLDQLAPAPPAAGD